MSPKCIVLFSKQLLMKKKSFSLNFFANRRNQYIWQNMALCETIWYYGSFSFDAVRIFYLLLKCAIACLQAELFAIAETFTLMLFMLFGFSYISSLRKTQLKSCAKNNTKEEEENLRNTKGLSPEWCKDLINHTKDWRLKKLQEIGALMQIWKGRTLKWYFGFCMLCEIFLMM